MQWNDPLSLKHVCHPPNPLSVISSSAANEEKHLEMALTNVLMLLVPTASDVFVPAVTNN